MHCLFSFNTNPSPRIALCCVCCLSALQPGTSPAWLLRLRIVEFQLDHEAPYFSNMRRRNSRKDSDLTGVVDLRYTGGARLLLMLELGACFVLKQGDEHSIAACWSQQQTVDDAIPLFCMCCSRGQSSALDPPALKSCNVNTLQCTLCRHFTSTYPLWPLLPLC